MLPEKKPQELLVMSHAVVGYPSLEANLPAIDGLVAAGVKMIELQIPFSDPVADGPTLAHACHVALKNGGGVKQALALAEQVSRRHPQVSFLLMSYLNPLYRYGLDRLFTDAAEAGVKGLIIPDLPVEALEPHLPLLDKLDLAPIMMVTPVTPPERLQRISAAARGMVYVVARTGVTGSQTRWDAEFDDYIARLKRYTDLPLAVGFGVRSAEDLRQLRGRVEVAAVCSRYIEWQGKLGSDAAAERMAELCEAAGGMEATA
ncbi:tryptophan synthase subunit alpha [Hahella sp. CR1]|uniref:tryptophan synthase subunit alpha n=1 Tax=unclassified Hahella TaxID=2624107 RepID=UPI0024413428|nr:tryptophan synthase subunit alpha [Hahella sp. CR1]MDG9666579.1 tryptophan synthase subunit alpha [Hahella sp. CR1]